MVVVATVSYAFLMTANHAGHAGRIGSRDWDMRLVLPKEGGGLSKVQKVVDFSKLAFFRPAPPFFPHHQRLMRGFPAPLAAEFCFAHSHRRLGTEGGMDIPFHVLQ